MLYDGQQNDTRMNLFVALTAAQHGAQARSHRPRAPRRSAAHGGEGRL